MTLHPDPRPEEQARRPVTLHALHAPRTRLAHQEHVIDEADSITSLSLSSDSRHVLVNTASEGIHSSEPPVARGAGPP